MLGCCRELLCPGTEKPADHQPVTSRGLCTKMPILIAVLHILPRSTSVGISISDIMVPRDCEFYIREQACLAGSSPFIRPD
jgi:hypothetical protein